MAGFFDDKGNDDARGNDATDRRPQPDLTPAGDGSRGPPEKIADITSLLERILTDQLVETLHQEVFNGFRSTTTLPEMAWPPSIKRIGRAEMIQALIPVYDAHFSHEEIQALLSFYTTPLGAKLNQLTPVLNHESMLAAQRVGLQFSEGSGERQPQPQVQGQMPGPQKGPDAAPPPATAQPVPENGGVICSVCKTGLEYGWLTCPGCRVRLEWGSVGQQAEPFERDEHTPQHASQKEFSTCPQCGNSVEAGWLVCSSCQCPLILGSVPPEPAPSLEYESTSQDTQGERFIDCPGCGSTVEVGWLMCPNCRIRLL